MRQIFKIGDLVRVADDYFVEEIRGWVGTISDAPQNMNAASSPGVYWVEFDSVVSVARPGVITGAEISWDSLYPAEEG